MNEQMHTLALTIGHNVGDKPTWDTQAVCKVIDMVLACPSYTVIPCIGRYNGMNETSTRIEVCDTKQNILSYVQRVPVIAGKLNQECILVQCDGLAALIGPADHRRLSADVA